MNRYSQWAIYGLAILMLTTGCATTRAKKPNPTAPDPNQQVAMLQNEVQAKDQQIQELQSQLASYQRSLQPTTNFTPDTYSSGSRSSSTIRVSGVSVSDVQRALKRAGYDPGPVDGRLGGRTKTAIKSFQSANGLKADGVVGRKTWSLLSQG